MYCISQESVLWLQFSLYRSFRMNENLKKNQVVCRNDIKIKHTVFQLFLKTTRVIF